MFRKREDSSAICVFMVCLAATGITVDVCASDDSFLGRVVMTQFPAAARDDASHGFGRPRDAAQLPLGARIVVFDASAPERGVTNLTPDFASAGRPDVSFDGTRILFVGKKAPADLFTVWEIASGGSALREIVRFGSDCLDVIHLSTMYTLNADQPVYQLAFTARSPEDGALSIYTCRMDGSAIRRITFAPGGASNPHQLSDGRILFRMGGESEKDVGGCAESGDAALFTINTDGTDLFPFGGFTGATPESRESFATPVLADPLWNNVDSMALAARREPAGRSSVVDFGGKVGQLYCLNAYLSDADQMSRASAAAIRGVRIWLFRERDHKAPTSGPLKSASATAAEPRQEFGTMVGDFQVESDGSFFLEVPARTPFRLETLDESGRALRTMRTWMWVMPGERRGCIGCHEDRKLTPPNRHVLGLRKPPQRIGDDALANPDADPQSPERYNKESP